MNIESKLRPYWWQTMTQRIASSKAGAWFFSRILHRLDKPILRLSNGQRSLTSILSGLPVVVLTTIGAKSGRRQSVPLLALIDEEKVIVIASNWGGAHHPAWYHNLRANPEASVSIGGQVGRYLAKETTDSEREQYWQQASAMYAGNEAYKRRAAGRKIPLFILKPKSA